MDAKQDVLSEEKEEFLINEFLMLSIQGAFQHAKIYRDSAGNADREEFKKKLLRERLCDAAMRIHNDEDLRKEIQDLQTASQEYSEFLEGGRLRIGICQKALNLFLKHKWVTGRAPEPPHCPFDSVVLDELQKRLRRRLAKWTLMDSIDEYDGYVKAADEVSRKVGMTIAEWELKLWNEAV